jgi:hypothetical protein
MQGFGSRYWQFAMCHFRILTIKNNNGNYGVVIQLCDDARCQYTIGHYFQMGLNFGVGHVQTSHSKCLYLIMPLSGGSKNLRGRTKVGMNKL